MKLVLSKYLEEEQVKLAIQNNDSNSHTWSTDYLNNKTMHPCAYEQCECRGKWRRWPRANTKWPAKIWSSKRTRDRATRPACRATPTIDEHSNWNFCTNQSDQIPTALRQQSKWSWKWERICIRIRCTLTARLLTGHRRESKSTLFCTRLWRWKTTREDTKSNSNSAQCQSWTDSKGNRFRWKSKRPLRTDKNRSKTQTHRNKARWQDCKCSMVPLPVPIVNSWAHWMFHCPNGVAGQAFFGEWNPTICSSFC